MTLGGLVDALLGRRPPPPRPPARLTEAEARAIAGAALHGHDTGALQARLVETQGRVVWRLHTLNRGANTFATIDDASGEVVEAGHTGGPYFVYAQSIPGPRPACRMTEPEAHAAARAAGGDWPDDWLLWTRGVTQASGRTEWTVGTAPVGPGTTVRIDDATGRVIELRRRPVR